ncbi:MAG: hypothetical protein Q9196_006553, partial [Gyalolechia fulgens]
SPPLRMARDTVIRRTHAQTPHGPRKEASEDHHIRVLNPVFPAFEQIQKYANEEEEKGAEEVRMDVHALVVGVEE